MKIQHYSMLGNPLIYTQLTLVNDQCKFLYLAYGEFIKYRKKRIMVCAYKSVKFTCTNNKINTKLVKSV